MILVCSDVSKMEQLELDLVFVQDGDVYLEENARDSATDES